MSAELLSTGLPTVAVAVGVVVSGMRFASLKKHMDSEFLGIDHSTESMLAAIRADLRRFEEVVDARLSRIEQELHLK